LSILAFIRIVFGDFNEKHPMATKYPPMRNENRFALGG